jgi:hypothetical protein
MLKVEDIQRLIVLMDESCKLVQLLLEEECIRPELKDELEVLMQREAELQFQLEGLKGMLQ